MNNHRPCVVDVDVVISTWHDTTDVDVYTKHLMVIRRSILLTSNQIHTSVDRAVVGNSVGRCNVRAVTQSPITLRTYHATQHDVNRIRIQIVRVGSDVEA